MNPHAQKSRPAIEGGKPLRKRFLPYYSERIPKKTEHLVMDVLRNGAFARGPKTALLEKGMLQLTGAATAVAMNSLSAALHVALQTAGIGQGHEVITTPFASNTSCNSILSQKATPVFIDIEPRGLTLDPSQIEAHVTPSTKAILPTHFAGYPADIDKIQRMADRFGLFIIENASGSLGAAYRGKRVGGISDFTCFSLYSRLSIAGGEGGLLTSIHHDQEPLIRTLGREGFTPSTWDDFEKFSKTPTDMTIPGFHYSLSDLHAAICLGQLPTLDKMREKRKKMWDLYDRLLAPVPAVKTPVRTSRKGHACVRYVVRLDLNKLRVDRDVIINAMLAENIGVGLHFKSLHLHPYFRKRLGYGPGMLPAAEDASSSVLSLPLHDVLTEKQVQQVAEALDKVVRFYLIT